MMNNQPNSPNPQGQVYNSDETYWPMGSRHPNLHSMSLHYHAGILSQSTLEEFVLDWTLGALGEYNPRWAALGVTSNWEVETFWKEKKKKNLQNLTFFWIKGIFK